MICRHLFELIGGFSISYFCQGEGRSQGFRRKSDSLIPNYNGKIVGLKKNNFQPVFWITQDGQIDYLNCYNVIGNFLYIIYNT